MILWSRDTAARYRLSNISLEYDAISVKCYVATIDELYTGTASVPYTKLTLINYHTLPKKDNAWKIGDLLLPFLDKHDSFVNKNEAFYKSNIKKILTTKFDLWVDRLASTDSLFMGAVEQ